MAPVKPLLKSASGFLAGNLAFLLSNNKDIGENFVYFCAQSVV